MVHVYTYIAVILFVMVPLVQVSAWNEAGYGKNASAVIYTAPAPGLSCILMNVMASFAWMCVCVCVCVCV